MEMIAYRNAGRALHRLVVFWGYLFRSLLKKKTKQSDINNAKKIICHVK